LDLGNNATFRTAGVGGTFDEIHKGHRALLLKAFQIGDRVLIGISSDSFAKKMRKPHATAPYPQRLRELKNFLIENHLNERAQVFPIDDIYGGVLSPDSPIEVLVVSKETERNAIEINKKRRSRGLKEFEIVVVDVVPAEDHESISTTRIRRGIIDREGHLLKKRQAAKA
jgi:pantetheine-phosphate adenylyltransferase